MVYIFTVVVPWNYFVFQDHCYEFEILPMTWEEARDSCELRGKRMVDIESEEELQWILHNLPGFIDYMS